MADITYSTACSIPTPKDVYDHPSLFANCVMDCSKKLLNRLNTSNYRSYIVAIAKYANENAPWSDETISKLSPAAKLLSDTIDKKGIIVHPLESVILGVLSCPNSENFRDFSDCFWRLKALI